MSRILEHHRVPLGPQITLLYQRLDSARTPLSVDCCFRLGFADGKPGQIYALMKTFQGQYAPAWRPVLTLTPDWTQLSFRACPEYRRALDEQWLQLFELESTLTELEPLRQGLLQEQFLMQESPLQALKWRFIRFAFESTRYDRQPMGQAEDLASLEQDDLLEAYLNLFARSQVFIRIRDHQPLHQVIERLRPLLARQSSELYRPQALVQELNGPREQALQLRLEGAWLTLGFVLPGMDQANWIYGPLLKAWLQDIWNSERPSEQLQLLEMDWLPWQQASLLILRMHTDLVDQVQELKGALIQWLVQARQGYLTSRRLRSAVQQAAQTWQTEETSLYTQLDELQDGWGHGRQRLHQLSLKAFQQAVSHYLVADHWVLQEACSDLSRIKHYDDHRKDMALLGFAPPRAKAQPPGRYQETARLYLGPEWTAWVCPQVGLKHLELGVWFASGSAGDTVPGTSWLLMQSLGQRFAELLEQQDERGALRQIQSWHTEVSRDFCFFKWACPLAETTQALKLLQNLLQDLPLDRLSLQALKQKHQARLQSRFLDPASRAAEQFALSGFANHPYAFAIQGSYTSLQQLGLTHLQQRWRELRQSALAQPLLLGCVPSSLTADLIRPAFEGIQESLQPVLALPELRVRRGEIQLLAEPKAYRLEGQIFAEALPLEQIGLLQLGLLWIQDQLRSRYGIPLQVESEVLKQAWYFSLTGIYSKSDRQQWLRDLRHLSEPLDMLKQRLMADWRLGQQQSSRCWSELVHWLNLGGSPAAFYEREARLLAVQREQLESFLVTTLTRDQDWLQIVFQGQPERVSSRYSL